jgi:hypothetical protein
MMYLLAILLGPLDAARGGYWRNVDAQLATAIYGLAVAVMLSGDPLHIILLTLAFALGEATGWGCPLGWALSGKDDGCMKEWWQFGALRRRPWLSLAVRGVLWGLPVALAGWLLGVQASLWMPAVMGAAMVAAPALVRASIGWRPAKHLWAAQEWVRGWLVGAMLLAAVLA